MFLKIYGIYVYICRLGPLNPIQILLLLCITLTVASTVGRDGAEEGFGGRAGREGDTGTDTDTYIFYIVTPNSHSQMTMANMINIAGSSNSIV